MIVESNSTTCETTRIAGFARQVAGLHSALIELEQAAGLLQLAPLAGREWYEVLTRKLLPQLAGDPFVVAAVVGGTNIGKSVIFNHLAGCQASATSPLASGTRHPVCLVPAGFAERHDLAHIFRGFKLMEWTDSAQSLEDGDEHRLFWKTSPHLPKNLLVLDTPDIDSDAQVNWHRADCIRHVADVLIAVLTQQKYNDAAVKQFFRNAAAEDKAVIVVFNQCLLPDDERYWPLWLETFSRETGIDPELVYVAPNDRNAAEENRLPFFERRHSSAIHEATAGTAGGNSPVSGTAARDVASSVLKKGDRRSLSGQRGEQEKVEQEKKVQMSLQIRNPKSAIRNHPEPVPVFQQSARHDLARDLSSLHFDSIKLRTLRGALARVVAADGAPAYLEEVKQRSAAFDNAERLLSMRQLARIDNWPPAPTAIVVSEIREWWRTPRHGLTKMVHDAYGTVGEGLMWPFRWARRKLTGAAPDPGDSYARAERDVMLQAVDCLYEELTRLSQLGNDLLKPRLSAMLAGASRATLLSQLAEAHAQLDIAQDLRQVVAAQMEAFRNESPNAFGLLRKLDSIAAVARPVTSVVLFVAAAGPIGHALTPMVTDVATQSLAIHIMGDIAGGTGAVVVGETALGGTVGGLRLLEARFRQLQSTFTARRVAWFAEFLRLHLLGDLHDDLHAAARLPETPRFRQLEAALNELTAAGTMPENGPETASFGA